VIRLDSETGPSDGLGELQQGRGFVGGGGDARIRGGSEQNVGDDDNQYPVPSLAGETTK